MSVVRVIDVQKQKKLSLTRSFKLVLSGISHRLFRSTLTMSVILLAVAFFMAMLSESMFIRSTAIGVDGEIEQLRESAYFLGFISNKPSSLVLSQRLAKAVADDEEMQEYIDISGVSSEALKELANKARLEQVYLRFFEGMDEEKRLQLVGKRSGREIFEFLVDEDEWRGFEKRLEPLKSLIVPRGTDTFRRFLQDYGKFTEAMNAFEKAWRKAIEAVEKKTAAFTGDKRLAVWLVEAPDKQVRAWQGMLQESGFRISDETLARIRSHLDKLHLRTRVIAVLTDEEVRKAWRKEYGRRMTIDEKLMNLTDPAALSILQKKFDHESLQQVSSLYKLEKTLNSLEKQLAGKTESTDGGVLSGRQFFLLVISFVVCMVGIANAMLMAITERFREIATMKCLGATDGYILTQFMMEAMMQGCAGGVLGMIIGFALATLKNGVLFGGYLFKYFPAADVLVCGLISLTLGVILAAIASLYPSWAASRMAPMEAMRIE